MCACDSSKQDLRGRKVTERSALQVTALLDFEHKAVVTFRDQALLGVRGNDEEKLRALYNAITKLPLGYNSNDDIAASAVVRDGYGQCNTKTILLMALARSVSIPSRVHAYRLTKELQRERHSWWLVLFMPRTTLFFWPEFYLKGGWEPLQRVVHEENKQWLSCPFDGARYTLEPVQPHWIERDDGVWESPDEYFAKHPPTVTGWRELGFRLFGRRLMNKRIARDAC